MAMKGWITVRGLACLKAGQNYNKILMAYEPGKNRYWVHCGDMKCNRWVQVDFNRGGGVTTTLMPKDYHFDFDSVATVVEGV